MDKNELRKQVLAKRDALTVEERKEKSDAISDCVTQHPIFKETDTILLYAAFRSEVDTMKIFRSAVASGKKVYFPKVFGNEMEFYCAEAEEDFEAGTWGILEPKVEFERKYVPKYKEKVCIIMPGAVFDKAGNRIGYGRGYYDKFLNRMEQVESFKMGIAFSCQLINIENFPKEEHDVGLDVIVTETEICEIICK